ncbi:organic hydroperoxide resistance protein [Rheinheimera sp. EpRS3]|uniref:organic hydroperoxide resistance protein n=1 Tax=Rheinheimera sp. EpRS3 TaxID=1712383 RepID=UPI001E33F7A8|nr:organic hydroperoxide resistance protein [Rheinheimera sp. EpRS3]
MMITAIEKVVYTGKTHTTGGRNGESHSSDGRLAVKLSAPGSAGPGTNPEQLLAAGWSACFIGAMSKAAAELNLTLPADTAVDAEIDLGLTNNAFFLQVRLNISLPGLDPLLANQLTEKAHQICPYSKATRDNVAVTLRLL